MPDSDTETEYYTIELEDISNNIMTDEEKEYLGAHHAIQLLVPFNGSNNIDVSDGAMGKLVHIDFNDNNEITRVWLEFSDAPKIGEKIRRKVSAYVQNNGISRNAVPISRRSSSVPLNNNKTIVAQRNLYPIISASAITIH